MARLDDVFHTKRTLRSAGRYMTVGLLGTLLDVALFTALRVLLGAPTLAANTLSYSAGIVNNYLLHRHWTFFDRPRKETAAQFTQFVAVSLSALLLNNLLVLLLTPAFASIDHGAGADILAKLGATAVSMFWNYLANNFWTFAQVKENGD